MTKKYQKLLAFLVCGGMIGSLFPFSASGSNSAETVGHSESVAADEYHMSINYNEEGSGHRHSTGEFIRIERQDPTCELPSMDVSIFSCAECGEEFPLIWRAAHENYQPSLGHQLENATHYENECGSYDQGYCTRCGKEDAINSQQTHSWKGWWIDEQPTCHSKGVLKNECTVCHLVKTEELETLSCHTITDWTLISPATCEEDGVYQGSCVNCGAIETKKTAALGHKYSLDVTVEPPTCTSEGRSYRACTRCGKINEKYLVTTPAKGHCYYDDGDCTTPVVCQICHTTIIEAKEHVFSSEWSHDSAQHFHSCMNEGCTARSDAANHTGSLISDDCTKGISCEVCGGVEVGGMQHDFENGVSKFYTFGYHTTKCANPGCKVSKRFKCTEGEQHSCTDPVVCSKCGTAMKDPVHNHNFSGTAVEEGDHHVYYCRNLHEKCTGKKVEAHKPIKDDGNCLTSLRCISCNAVITPAEKEHQFGTVTWTDENGNAYHACLNGTCTVRQYVGHESYDSEQHNYVNGKCTICGMTGESVGGHSLTLNGRIEINFYMSLNDSIFNDKGAYMNFTTSDGNEKVYVSAAKDNIQNENGVNYYVFTCSVAPKDVNSEIRAQMVLGDGTKGKLYTYSIREYANSIYYTAVSNETKELVDAMMNYGECAESYFANSTVGVPDVEVRTEELEKYKLQKQNELPDGIQYVGSSLMLDASVTVRHYFSADSSVDVSAYGFKKNTANGYYFVEISDICANELSKPVETKIGDFVLTYSPMSYVYSVLHNENSDENLINLVKALYLYHQASTKV